MEPTRQQNENKPYWHDSMPFRRAIQLAVLCVLLSFSALWATELYVDCNANIIGQNGTIEHPFVAIQPAIDVAVIDQRVDVITVSPGVYRENITLLEISQNLVLRSLFDPWLNNIEVIDNTIVRGLDNVIEPTIFIDNCMGTVCLQGISVTNGKGKFAVFQNFADRWSKGGGICAYSDHEVNQQVEVKWCNIYANYACWGGGIYGIQTSFEIEDCRVHDNGLYYFQNEPPHAAETGYDGPKGGGVYLAGGYSHVRRCRIFSNTSYLDATHELYNSQCYGNASALFWRNICATIDVGLIMEECQIYDNVTSTTNALMSVYEWPFRSIIMIQRGSDNIAPGEPGYNRVEINNCTITDNKVVYDANRIEGNTAVGILRLADTTHILGTITNNIIYNNTAGANLTEQNLAHIRQLMGGAMNQGLLESCAIPIRYCCVNNAYNNIWYLDEGNGSIDLNPCFSNPTTHDYKLRWDEEARSPAILTGYYEEPVSNQANHRPDMGALQFAEFPHENRTYTFPAGNDRNGVKWMSFPTLDRVYSNQDYAYTFFARLLNETVIDNISWKVLNDDPDNIYFDNNELLGSDHIIQPQIGYKFQMDENLQLPVCISTPGRIVAPDLSINLIARTNSRVVIPDNENWLGYYGVGTVHPYDAFASILDNLWYIQSQNWTLARWSAVPGSPWIGISYPGAKPPTLKYGDMVIVKCFNDASFTWNGDAPPRDEFIKDKPSNFTFTEKMAYVPVYVEFNPNEIPKEAAVYVNGECKGAAVVGGSSVEIPAYILDDIGSNAELELRVYYNSKTAYNPSPRYRTWSMNNEKFEECTLTLSELKPYYMLKMDGASLSEAPAPKLYMANYPNPFNPETTIRYSLPVDADISLDIYNVKGQKVRNLASGFKTYGDFSCVWDAKDNNGSGVACGMYFAVLSYNGKQISRKLMLMK